MTTTPYTSYTNIVDTRPRKIGQKLWTNGVQDTLLLQLLGEDSFDSKFNATSPDNCKIEWIETGLTPNTAKVTAAVTAPTTTGNDVNGNPVYAAQTLTVDFPDRFTRGQVWFQAPPTGYTVLSTDKADGYQYFWVVSVNAAANQVTVLPGFLGTKNHAVAANAEICLLTSADVECAEWQSTFVQQRVTVNNYVQMFTDWISMSEKEMLLGDYAVANRYELELRRIMGGMVGSQRVSGDLYKKLENALWYGLKNVGSETYPATLGGINSFGIQNFTEAALDRELIERVSYAVYSQGSNAMDIVVGGSLMQEIANWYDPYVRTDGLRDVGGRVEKIRTAYGEYNIHHHRGLRPNEIYFLDLSKIGVYKLQDFMVKPLSTNGFCDKWGISGYFSLALANPCHHARITLSSACFTGKEPFACSSIDLTPTAPKSPGVV